MTAAARPTIANPDVTQARLISRTYDETERCELIAASIPSRRDSEVRYIVEGHTHGRDARCSCLGWRRWRRCCHCAAFVLILEELERAHYDNPAHTTARLLELARWYDSVSDVLNADQRLRFNGIKAALRDRGVRFESTRTLAEQAEVARKARRAQDELFG